MVSLYGYHLLISVRDSAQATIPCDKLRKIAQDICARPSLVGDLKSSGLIKTALNGSSENFEPTYILTDAGFAAIEEYERLLKEANRLDKVEERAVKSDKRSALMCLISFLTAVYTFIPAIYRFLSEAF